MRLIVCLRHPGAVRNFESVLEALAGRGHDVRVAFEAEGRAPAHAVLSQRLADLGITSMAAPERSRPRLRRLDRALRGTLDYLRYLEPAYADAPALRGRAERHAIPAVRRLAARGRVARAVATRLARSHRLLPADPAVRRWLEGLAPDAVILSPLVDFASPQHDYVAATRAAGIPSIMLLHSWDNLTNKGLIHLAPTAMTVWNDDIKTEAVELHRIPADRVTVTGASTYDHWFGWRVSRDRGEFCADVGLDPTRPFVLWLCSSPFIAPDEVAVVRAWIESLRAHSSLGQVGVLVRPHPQNARQWRDVAFDDIANVAISPRHGEDPVSDDARQRYYDTMYHSAVVAGLNTSALIESAIVGRPVVSLVTQASRDTQYGTLHFRLLLRHSRGFLRTAESVDEHLESTADALAGGHVRDEAFLRSFVRPRGVDVPATPAVVEVIEAVGGAA